MTNESDTDDDYVHTTQVDEQEKECFYDCLQEEMGDVTFMPATSSSSGRDVLGQRDLGFDSDSHWVAVDNCCTSCISNCLDDFVGPMTRVTARVRGIGGVQVIATLKGSVRWRINDNDGRTHTFLIENSFYHKDSPY